MAGLTALRSMLCHRHRPVDYAAVFRQKLPLLFLAARNFARSAAPNARARYENFCRQTNGGSTTSFSLTACARVSNWKAEPLAAPSPIGTSGDREGARRNARRPQRPPRRSVFFLRTVAGAPSLLRPTCDPRRGRHRDLREFRQRRCLDHPELFRSTPNSIPRSWPASLPIFSAKTASAGQSLVSLDVMKEQGYAWWIERMRWPRTILTTFASITSAASPSSGNPRQRTHRHSWSLGRRSEGRPIREAARSFRRPSIFRRRSGIHHARRARTARAAEDSGMAVLQFGFGDVARMPICRTPSPPKRSCTPARTTTTRC